MPTNPQNDPMEQLADAGAKAAQAATQAATQAANAAAQAISSIDFDGLATSLQQAAQDVAKQIADRGKSGLSPYVVVESGAGALGMGKVAGGILLVCAAGAAALVTGGLSLFTASWATAAGGIASAAVGAGGLALVADGVGTRVLADAVKSVSQAAGTRTAIGVEELSQEVHIPAPKLRKHLQKAIKRGLVPQGHLGSDAQGRETLYLTDDAWEAQLRGADEARARTRLAAEQASEQARIDASLPEDAQDVLAACAAFRARMEAAAASVASAGTRNKMTELSGKAARLEGHVRSHPNDARRLERLASYYLPTTAKLAEAYAELDSAQAHGSNADATRREVDGALDEMSGALDRLQDDLLIGQTWDVASDASVMRTLLSQDGLADADAAEGPAGTSTEGQAAPKAAGEKG